jgi:glycogen synthase
MNNKIMVNVNGIDRDATPEEIESILVNQANEKVKADAEKADAEAKAAQKAALLERLGITEDEARLLLA